MINYFVVPVTSVFLSFIYIIINAFQLNRNFSIGYILFDELSIFILYMTSFVIFVSFIYTIYNISREMTLVLLMIFAICFLAFIVNNMFIFYLFYEASLIPILYIIIKWGSYPERSVRSIILLVYTSIFTFPFVYSLFTLYSLNNSFQFYLATSYALSSRYSEFSFIFSLLIFITFAVKLPVYGLHFWLPMAHVEAPTFGSIILAGILLKLGGVGLIRFSRFINIAELKMYLLSYLLVFLVYVTLVCCFQSDFKRLVAYSSVSHITTIPVIILSSSLVGIKGIIRIIFLHGISSPLMFMLVGTLYLYTSTRQHVLMRGLLCVRPLFSFFMVLSFFFTMSAPPFPSFMAEIMFSLRAVIIWFPRMFFLFFFLFLSIVYNLLWFSSSLFLNQDSYVNYSFQFYFCYFISILFCLFIIPIVFVILFYFVF